MEEIGNGIVLYPVVNQENLIGISKEDDGYAIISMKNQVILVRLSDQKQLKTWIIEGENLSAKVIYNPNEQVYVGLFDNIYVKQWDKSESTLKNVKTNKFCQEIHEILTYKKSDELILVALYKNGYCEDLTTGMNHLEKKSVSGFPKNILIKTAEIIPSSNYLVIIAKSENKDYICVLAELFVEGKTIIIDQESINQLLLKRNNLNLQGYCITWHGAEKFLYTYWSDGILHCMPLPFNKKTKNFQNNMGTSVRTLKAIDRNEKLKIVPISNSHLAFYALKSSVGEEKVEEKAVLGIYNIKNQDVACSTFNMFNRPPKLELINQYLIFLVDKTLMESRLPDSETMLASGDYKALNKKKDDLNDKFMTRYTGAVKKIVQNPFDYAKEFNLLSAVLNAREKFEEVEKEIIMKFDLSRNEKLNELKDRVEKFSEVVRGNRFVLWFHLSNITTS